MGNTSWKTKIHTKGKVVAGSTDAVPNGMTTSRLGDTSIDDVVQQQHSKRKLTNSGLSPVAKDKSDLPTRRPKVTPGFNLTLIKDEIGYSDGEQSNLFDDSNTSGVRPSNALCRSDASVTHPGSIAGQSWHPRDYAAVVVPGGIRGDNYVYLTCSGGKIIKRFEGKKKHADHHKATQFKRISNVSEVDIGLVEVCDFQYPGQCIPHMPFSIQDRAFHSDTSSKSDVLLRRVLPHG